MTVDIKMRFPEAFYQACRIQKKHPEYVLCGSIAMILAKEIKVRDVGDIDFVVAASQVDEELLKKVTYGGYGAWDKGDGYRHYKITQEAGLWHYCLFVVDDEKLSTRDINFNIKIQAPEDMIHWKRFFARKKDKEDLNVEL